MEGNSEEKQKCLNLYNELQEIRKSDFDSVISEVFEEWEKVVKDACNDRKKYALALSLEEDDVIFLGGEEKIITALREKIRKPFEIRAEESGGAKDFMVYWN